MTNPHFIKLLEILEERDWEYEINSHGIFYVVIGNQEFEFDKTDKAETLELIDLLENW